LHLLGEVEPARALLQVLLEWQARAMAARTGEVSLPLDV
jgi:hypothetical protein